MTLRPPPTQGRTVTTPRSDQRSRIHREQLPYRLDKPREGDVTRRTPRKSGLTIAEHQELGAELAAIRERLAELSIAISSAYPFKSAVGRLTCQAGRPQVCKGLDALRDALEDAMLTEHRGNARATTGVYWPARTPR
jgi:hypothetical protein